MKIIALSDTHGSLMLDNFALLLSDADIIAHLGDGYNDAQHLSSECGKSIISLKGNCDFSGQIYQTLVVEGHTILFTHGHAYGVKSDLMRLNYFADEIGADIVFYGHTHIPDVSFFYNKWFINPGSLGRPRNGMRTYVTVNITADSVKAEIKEYKTE